MANFRPAGWETESNIDDFFDDEDNSHSDEDAPGPPVKFQSKASAFSQLKDKEQGISPGYGRGRNFSLDLGKEKSVRSRADMVKKISTTEKSDLRSSKPVSAINTEKVITVDDFRAAVVSNNIESVLKFLESGFVVDTIFTTKWTPLMYAAYHGHDQLVELLVKRGADVNFNADLSTVTMMVCSSACTKEENLLKCLNILLQNGAKINEIDRLHMSALMHASQKGLAQIVKILLASGASKDLKDSKGRTALMIATVNGHLHVVHALLEGGVDVTVKNNLGSTALDLASMQGQSHVYELIKKWTSDISGDGSLPITAEDVKKIDEQKKAADRAEAERSLAMPEGELEMILRSLDLSRLIPNFRQHRIAFKDFLRFTDSDLQAVGVVELGVRKKILDYLRESHKKEWQASSLMSIQYNKKISLAEAIAMISNLRKHSSYMASTVGYVCDQLKADLSIVTSNPQENAMPQDLEIKIDETIVNLRNLHQELLSLRQHISEVAKLPQCYPPDLITYQPSSNRSHTVKKILLIGFSGLVLISGFVYLKHNIKLET